MENQIKLIGPFKQLLTMDHLPEKGAILDAQLEIIDAAAICISNGKIIDIGHFQALQDKWANQAQMIVLEADYVALPGYIDCHTHIAFGGNRAQDFAMRNAGQSYLAIAAAGGGIWSTVAHTRACHQAELRDLTIMRSRDLMKQGITTIEVKSGYGLSILEELKILRSIKEANEACEVDLISTCLAAHMKPKDFDGSAEAYLQEIAEELFPVLIAEKLTHRMDVFIEESAFTAEEAKGYLLRAKDLGFDISIHADQFTNAGSALAVELKAVSADHLEASKTTEINRIADSDVVAVALPAASLGLGCAFTPARQLLDAGACLAIASDWNPGSAPMGRLMEGASILASMEKLSNAEVLSALTNRAAKALRLADRGKLKVGLIADFMLYKTANYQNITYLQGGLQPEQVWKNGQLIYTNKTKS
ncbi:imidazolonepropionase [Sphingobacterium sp. HJSM2_6]|uniref:imidazolonepropionase n=1 Tax=Sphingobacterium sp. HJSM2_6 TaxID=3366264 RepID=UPI003BBFE320